MKKKDVYQFILDYRQGEEEVAVWEVSKTGTALLSWQRHLQEWSDAEAEELTQTEIKERVAAGEYLCRLAGYIKLSFYQRFAVKYCDIGALIEGYYEYPVNAQPTLHLRSNTRSTFLSADFRPISQILSKGSAFITVLDNLDVLGYYVTICGKVFQGVSGRQVWRTKNSAKRMLNYCLRRAGIDPKTVEHECTIHQINLNNLM